jgi:outer membrane receptor protein involved in Fe transport
VDGIPVNMPTHAHGQGYTDLNFLIPELVDRIEYKKGTYYAEEGNFSAAGAADIHYRRKLEQPVIVELAGGQYGFRRGLVAFSRPLAGGDLLVGGECGNNDGPWDLKEDYRQASGLAKFSKGDALNGYAITAMGYSGDWRSTDQIPLRALRFGEISRFGAIDPTDGGTTHRYSVSVDAGQQLRGGELKVSGYGIDYKLDLISNFTYATDQVHGDQFEQFDQRRVYGGAVAFTLPSNLLGRSGTFQSGVQVRSDEISPVALYLTEQRIRYDAIRQDRVRQTSYALHLSQDLQWTPWFRGVLGLRADDYRFDVRSNLPVNSGQTTAAIVSPKLALVFGPWARTEYFFDLGSGYHSNDARGTTIRVDPNDGVTPVSSVTPLVRALGAEVGLRTALIPRVQLAVSLWTLKLASELLFTGDGGTTEPSRASRRYGVELGAYFSPTHHIVTDMDLAWSHARFTAPDPAGDRIPNALETVASIGLSYKGCSGMYGGARLRYFGPGPLAEDNSVRSHSTTLVNLTGGYHFSRALSADVSVFNLLNRKDNDISYFYESQLKGEPVPVADIHLHPVEPRTVRLTVTFKS